MKHILLWSFLLVAVSACGTMGNQEPRYGYEAPPAAHPHHMNRHHHMNKHEEHHAKAHHAKAHHAKAHHAKATHAKQGSTMNNMKKPEANM